jgi:hypothetical protein
MAVVRRFVLNLLAVLSLLLGVAVAASWVRSYHGQDRVIYQSDHDARGEQRCFLLAWNCGVFEFQHYHIAGLGRTYAERVGLHTDHAEARPYEFETRPGRDLARLGFRLLPPVTQAAPPALWRHYSVYVPHYAVVTAAGILPAARLLALGRRKRIGRAGFCPSCGYDLRATPGRCPECGGPVVRATPAA